MKGQRRYRLLASRPRGWEEKENKIRLRLAESLDEQSSSIRQAFYDQFERQSAPLQNSIYVREVFSDYVIAEAGSEGMFKIGYRTTDSKIEFDSRDKWIKIEVEYIPAKASANLNLMMASTLAAPKTDTKGTSWDVTIIKTGKTLTKVPVWVSKEALEASIPAFQGAKVYAVNEGDAAGHKSDPNKKVVREVVGFLENPYVDGEELKATLSILPSEQWLRDNLLFLESKNQLGVYQLSVDSIIAAAPGTIPGTSEKILLMSKIVKADLDIVGEAAAGGKFNRLVASQQSHTGDFTMLKNKLMTLFLLVYPTFLASKNIDVVKVDENELFTHLLAADKAQPRLKLPDGMQLDEKVIDAKLTEFRASLDRDAQAAAAAEAAEKEKNKKKDLDNTNFQAALDPVQKEIKALRLQACAATLKVKVGESNLPKHLQASIEKQWKDKTFTDAELDDYIKNVREMFAPFTQPDVNNLGMDVRMGADERDKFQAALDGFFLCSSQALKPVKAGTDEYKTLLGGVDPFRSIKEAYIQFTGDTHVTGRVPKNSRFTASLSTTDWASILANTLNRRLVRDYAQLGLDTWRAIVDIVPLSDFKEQQRVRYGGYPNLAIVGQRDPYPSLVSPTDEKATYTPAKRGGTEDITREMIMNDDVGSVQKIPIRMARAAGQTLHEFVYDFIRPEVNPLIYDGIALYIAGHSNTGTAALAADGVAFSAARLRMKKQAMKDNNKRLGIRAGYLFVPSDLEQIAYGLLTPAFNKSNTVPEFLQQIGVTPVVVDYWADANDWLLAARREDLTGLEIGFINGQETPEIFVSDLPNAGSFFTNDVITYKIRHEYGGNIMDFRAFDGSIVAA